VISEHGGKPWLSDYSDENFTSGRNAMKRGIIFLDFIRF